MDSQRLSEDARALNFLQVIPKEIIESMGRRRRIVKRWSWAMLVIGDPLLETILVLVLVLESAMEEAFAFVRMD